MYQMIDGRKWAGQHGNRLREQLKKLPKQPALVSFLVGEDSGSVLYTDIKQKKAAEFGIDFRVAKYPADVEWKTVVDKIRKLNSDPEIDGIMVQLPLPKEFLKGRREEELIEEIDPKKDVDGLRIDSPYLAATVRAILALLEDEAINLTGKRVVIVGAKGEVGSRLVKVLEERGVEVRGVDREAGDLGKITQEADVLISSTGVAHLISEGMVKDGAVVIDVGSEKLPDGRVVGDVDFASVAPKASKITPVPGGVGPMTVVSLMENVVESVSRRNQKDGING